MKTVQIIINSLVNGGAERVAVNLAEFLVTKGCSVTIITIDSKKTDFYRVIDGIKRLSIDMAGHSGGIWKFTRVFNRMLALRRIFKEQSPDMVIGIMTTSAVLCICSAFGLKVKVAISERNNPYKKQIPIFWDIMRKLLYKFSYIQIAQTQACKKWFKNITKTKNVVVIPNAVKYPLPVYEPILMPQECFNNSINVILAIGRLHHQKGFDLLIEAYLKSMRDMPQHRLVILGEGEERNNLEKVIKERAATNIIYLPGRVGNIGEWYMRADIFVMSSRYEGFPNALLEAMASGCACISFDCETGPNEIIVNGENGVLVPAGNTTKLSNAIKSLSLNKDLRKILSKEAVKIRMKYSEQNIYKKWYQNLFC